VLSTLLFVATCQSVLWAFGEEGHQIVARIAESHLSEKAKAGVKKLLGRKHLPTVANWADDIKDSRPETRPWHYVDIPITFGKFDPETQCADDNCIIVRIEEFKAILADKNSSRRERQEALKFLVHLVGDLHQPLHCAERMNNKGKGDGGGNNRTVKFPGVGVVKLHGVWDTNLVTECIGEKDPLEYAEALNGKVTADKKTAWSKGDVEDWAIETHKLAVSTAYKEVPADGPAQRLSADYVEKGKSVVEEQLMKAGVRLALVLNEAFD